MQLCIHKLKFKTLADKSVLCLAIILMASISWRVAAETKACIDIKSDLQNATHDQKALSRFDLSATGLVKDRDSGLTWKRCNLGQRLTNGRCETGKQWNSWFSWSAAHGAIENFQSDGFSDWRLPTVDELESLVEANCYLSTASTELFFPAANHPYWTSTTDSENADYAWVVDFKRKEANSELKINSSYGVRLVRGQAIELTKSGALVSVSEAEKVIVDDIHDADNPDLRLLQRPEVAFEKLSHARSGQVDWVASLKDAIIQPRTAIETLEDDKSFDLNIVMAITKKMPYVLFQHSVHTEWLTCSNCHPAIFKPQVGANNIKMDDILKGEFCGKCHGSVAFSPLECERCHSILHKASPMAWWKPKQPKTDQPSLNELKNLFLQEP